VRPAWRLCLQPATALNITRSPSEPKGRARYRPGRGDSEGGFPLDRVP
jgi:hypothetical protein